ncbi:hypothetical protein ACNI5A_34095, partial [Klebsiella pneumoniae]|uniref:hypothetical protein n=1 Tax=Klebsiella pneumoniae TaxID=573 RepID=UPI003A8C4E0C
LLAEVGRMGLCDDMGLPAMIAENCGNGLSQNGLMNVALLRGGFVRRRGWIGLLWCARSCFLPAIEVGKS